jgi:rhamnopyranosyl-N-acetylglucosaminyl-diphospho-decaprenol beta-1,3/1,4-galactofuranosyltransferase
MTTHSIASVTVSYNSARVLPRQLDALRRQTRALQEIVIVDNASTDGTCALLAERYPEVTVLQMAENIGAAGAWAAGLSYAALEKGHDWVWSFDDDSVPEPDVLEALLSGIEIQGEADGAVGMAAPVPVHRKTGTRYPPYLWCEGFVKPSDELMNQPIWFADLIIASGCLVRRDVVQKIGLPRADFFMDFFDFEYCLRARQHNYKIAVISRAQLAHEVGNGRRVKLLWYSRLWGNQPPWREYYISRNLVYSAWWLYPSAATKWSIALYLAKHAAGVPLFGSHKIACLVKMAQGIWDGRRAILGIRFRPDQAQPHPANAQVGVSSKVDLRKA